MVPHCNMHFVHCCVVICFVEIILSEISYDTFTHIHQVALPAYDCPNASEVTLMNMGKIGLYYR